MSSLTDPVLHLEQKGQDRSLDNDIIILLRSIDYLVKKARHLAERAEADEILKFHKKASYTELEKKHFLETYQNKANLLNNLATGLVVQKTIYLVNSKTSEISTDELLSLIDEIDQLPTLTQSVVNEIDCIDSTNIDTIKECQVLGCNCDK